MPLPIAHPQKTSRRATILIAQPALWRAGLIVRAAIKHALIGAAAD